MRLRVDESLNGKRLDQALKSLLPDFSRSALQKLIKDGACDVGGHKALSQTCRVYAGQIIDIEIQEAATTLEAEDGECEVIWQDNDLAVCVKPPDLAVHPCPSLKENTLIQRLIGRFPQLAAQEGDRPGIIHRLDKDTSGLIVVALNETARLRMASQFARREVEKEYLAIVAGAPPVTGKADQPLGRHPVIKTRMGIVDINKGGREARTEWRRLWHDDHKEVSLLAVRIFTGRTHQIRVHLSNLGYPVIGDQTYGNAWSASQASRQMLHAWRLEFDHPATGQRMKFVSPPPEDFFDALLIHGTEPVNVVVTGNPGCGKSTFTSLLAQKDIPVISADQIVADLYATKSAVTDWLEIRGLKNLLDEQGHVDKTALFAWLKRGGSSQTEFEKFVHLLARDRIDDFWTANKHAELCAAAEIPLYFESGWQKTMRPKPLTVGVHCPDETRWNRIRETRHWPEEKIASIDSWQLPEQEKMAKCDLVVNNTGDLATLEKETEKFLAFLKDRKQRQLAKLETYFRKICSYDREASG